MTETYLFRIDRKVRQLPCNLDLLFPKINTSFILDETEERIELGSGTRRRHDETPTFAFDGCESFAVNQKTRAHIARSPLFLGGESRQFPRAIYHSISGLLFFRARPRDRSRRIFRRNPRPRSIDPPDTGHLYLWGSVDP